MEPFQSHTIDVGSHILSAEPKSAPGANRNWLRPGAHAGVVEDIARIVVPEIAREANARLVGRQAAKLHPEDSQGRFPISHIDTFQQVYQSINRTYWTRYDEALKHSRENARVMENDTLLYSLQQRRFIPTCILTHQLETDDPDNPEQAAIARRLDRMVNKIKRFHFLKRQLNGGNWQGHAGAQMFWQKHMVDGAPATVPRKWLPIHGDKIVYGWDHEPAIAVRAGSDSAKRHKEDVIRYEYGEAISLRRPHLRDCFAIHEFEPADRDFLYEGELAGQVHGLGLRSRCYWAWYLRTEGLGYVLDALQRISSLGMLVGYFDSGNADSQDAVLQALINVFRDNMTTFPRSGSNTGSCIEHIQPGNVAYDVLFRFMEYMDELMLLAFLGQTLTSQAGATGLGSKVAELHSDTKLQIIKYDALSLAETINDEIIDPMIRMNRWSYGGRVYHGSDLPFGINFRFSIDDSDVEERVQAAEALSQLQIPYDGEPLRKELGFSPPKDGSGSPPPTSPLDMVGTGAQAPEGLDSRQAELLGMQAPPATGRTTVQMSRRPYETNRPNGRLNPESVAKYGAAPVHVPPTTATFSLRVPPAIAEAMVLQGGNHVDDLHIPLATVSRNGWGRQEVSRAYSCLRRLANRWKPFRGKLNGVSRQMVDGAQVISATADCPGMAEARMHLVHILAQVGLEADANHAWAPAVPLAKLQGHEPTSGIHIPDRPVDLNEVTLSVGGKSWSIPLSGSRVARYGREPLGVVIS